MKHKTRTSLFTLILLLLFSRPVQATNITQITVDEMGIPFVLDDKGYVWGFKEPHDLRQHPIKLNLEHIKKIAPYIALDEEGRVFTWGIDDKKVRIIEDEFTEAGYTAPQRVGDLQGVTMIAHSMNHFFAVINNQEIVEWTSFRKKDGWGTDRYGTIKQLISKPGIKAIATAPGTLKPVVSEPAPFSLVALFDDGSVMGWGITSSGQILKDANPASVLLTQSQGAVGIAMNDFHTVILTANGATQFWGSCDLYGKDGNGRPWTPTSLQGMDGYVTDVIGMALAQDVNIGVASGWGNDNEVPDVFIKRDGTVWIAPAPLAAGIPGSNCSQNNPTINYRQAQQLPAGKAAALQVATAGGVYLMLDADHKLWSTIQSYGKKEFRNVPINLK